MLITKAESALVRFGFATSAVSQPRSQTCAITTSVIHAKSSSHVLCYCLSEYTSRSAEVRHPTTSTVVQEHDKRTRWRACPNMIKSGCITRQS